MSLSIFITITLAAFIHAAWNSLVKSSPNKYYMTGALSTITAFLLLFFLPFVPFPPLPALPYFIGSVILQIIYYILLAKTYRLTDIGLSYPIMRGAAPLLVSIFSYFVWHENISLFGWFSIILIVCGILLLGLNSIRHATPLGLLLALSNAFIIAIYTIVDGLGVRAANSALSYSVWLFFISMILVAIWVLLLERQKFISFLRKYWKSAAIAGIGSSLSYGIILWCMLYAPIYMVSALREMSIFFVICIATFYLKENVNYSRIIAGLFILIGAILLKLT